MRLIIKGRFYYLSCNAEEGEVEIIMIGGKKYTASIIFSRGKMGFYSSAASVYNL